MKKLSFGIEQKPKLKPKRKPKRKPPGASGRGVSLTGGTVTVSVATVLVASPHLARPTRRFGEGLVALLALSSLYLSRGFPTDLFAAIVLGWGVAHLVEWIFGTPVGRPARRQVEDALTKLGVPVRVTVAPGMGRLLKSLRKAVSVKRING